MFGSSAGRLTDVMAIWPFGRKGKRHTVQVDADRGVAASPQGARHSFDEGNLGRKPTREHSKRRKNRYSQPVNAYSGSSNNASGSITQPTPSGFHSEQNRSANAHAFLASSAPTTEPHPLSRNPSLRKHKRNGEGPATLKKRLSKRKAYAIAREREVRLMSSMPIDIPRRATPSLPGDSMHIDGRRASAHDRRWDRHRSDISLSMHDSAASSLSDYSDNYTFKVNGFAAWTPRPVIRYVETPRTSYSRHRKSPEPAEQRSKSPTLEVSNEDLRSKKRIDDLANGLDAGGLRELMERDRRRQERKQVKDQEKLVRKLQHTAEKVPKSGDEPDGSQQLDQTQDTETKRGRSSSQNRTQSQPTTQETEAFLSGEPEGSWLRDTSRDQERNGRMSPETVNIIGNIDDSSIREQKTSQRFSFRPSQDVTMSRSTLAASLSPSRRGVHSPDSSQLYGMARSSVSDVSRNVASERRSSDHGTGHASTITSIFRRGSSRLKRSYRERFPDRSPPPQKNVSHESFFKVHTQPPAPTPYVPSKALLGPTSFKRSQSKFIEHFGDEPLSPPDSRLQSPDIPEHEPQAEDRVPDLQSGSYYPIPGTGTNNKNRHHSWAGDSVEEDPEHFPLSQSLASIDSEGSWMSGQFLRRISQRQANSARQSLSSSRNKDEGAEKSLRNDENHSDAQSTAFGVHPGEASGDGNNATADNQDKDFDAPAQQGPSAETWHQDVGKRPVLVNPVVRPKSTEGLLKNVRSLSPISAEAEFSPIEEHSAEIFSVDDEPVNPVPARQ